ncbi:hypothetical protein TRIATDRAFT_302723, partial [Trichoderma atroviride IMI 206040]
LLYFFFGKERKGSLGRQGRPTASTKRPSSSATYLLSRRPFQIHTCTYYYRLSLRYHPPGPRRVRGTLPASAVCWYYFVPIFLYTCSGLRGLTRWVHCAILDAVRWRPSLATRPAIRPATPPTCPLARKAAWRRALRIWTPLSCCFRPCHVRLLRGALGPLRPSQERAWQASRAQIRSLPLSKDGRTYKDGFLHRLAATTTPRRQQISRLLASL